MDTENLREDVKKMTANLLKSNDISDHRLGLLLNPKSVKGRGRPSKKREKYF